MRRTFGIGVLCLVAVGIVAGQEREDRTLLPQEQMTAIVNEVSGERALHTVLELAPYPRVRLPAEYSGHFHESEVMARLAREYGFSNVTIESFDEGKEWQPTIGELWMTTPSSIKLYDVHDVPVALASRNVNGEFTGTLVDVGQGRAQDFEGKDVAGHFVLASSGLGGAYRQAVQRGARGVLAVSAIGSQRAVDYPDQIVETEVTAQAGSVAWAISPKVHAELLRLLRSGQPVTIRSVNTSVEVPSRSEIVHAEIPGDGSTTQEVAIGGHLYEGVIKQGANDDLSGCGLTLEIGRAYLKLIADGKLPRPKRTINFQWLAEISGTDHWLKAHPEKAARLIGDLNFDMEGIRLATSRSYWVLQRTPDSFPSFINDIAQSMMEYVADVSRERVRFRANGYAPSQRIEAPNGSSDAFYIKIDKHYGSSDHVVYMQHGIPAVMFITWPDMWYHSSQDTPDKQDPTQYKRAAVVGTGSLAALASGTDEMAARVLDENLGRGLSRMGESHAKGLGYLADATDAAGLATAYKEAQVAVRHQADVEKGVVRSASVLWTDVDTGKKKTAVFEPLVDRRATVLLDEVRAAYELQARQRGITPAAPVRTPEEREAASLRVERVPGQGGFFGPPRGGAAGPRLPQEMNAEFNLLLDKKMTALEIRDFLAGEFTPLPLADLMAVLRARETAGSVKLTPVAAAAPAR